MTYTKEKPDRVSVRAWYQLKNTGKVPLAVMSIELPIHPTFTDNLRVEWNGNGLASPAVPSSDHQLQFTLGSSWKPTERGEFVVTYELKVVDPMSPVVAGGGAPFFLPSRDWYPVLAPPTGTFSEPNPSPNKWDLVVTVPQGYHIYASGRAAGTDRSSEKRPSGGISLRFEQRPLIDFNSFVAAGPYVEQQVKTSNGTVVLWTSKPVADKRAHEISNQVSIDAKYLVTEFGLPNTGGLPVYIIECSPGVAFIPTDHLQRGCTTEPRSAVMPFGFFSSDSSEPVDLPVDYQLAQSWFYMSIRAAHDEPPWPVNAVSAYAADGAIASRNATSRANRIRLFLNVLNSAKQDMEKPILAVKHEEPDIAQAAAFMRSELFFFALEDRCGEKNVHRALARILRILRGKTWGVSDLRSAMEAECGGAGLADFFREWLNKPGIPEEFRARYSGPAPAK